MANPTHLKNSNTGVIVPWNLYAAAMAEMEPYDMPVVETQKPKLVKKPNKKPQE